MRAGTGRPVLRVRRRDRLMRMTGLSLLLHLLPLLALLSMPHPPPLTQAAGPVSIEVVADAGTANGVKLPAPSFAPAIVRPLEPPATEPPPPASAPAPAMPEASIPPASMPAPPSPLAPPPVPAPTPAAPPSPAAPPAAALPAPPSPAAPPAAALPAPPAPPPAAAPTATAQPPVPLPRTAERPPSRPAPSRPAQPAPTPFASGSGRLLLPFARNAPEPTTLGHGAIDLSLGPQAFNSVGPPPRTTRGLDASIRVEGAQVGNDWIEQLHEWWDRHAYYPPQAIANYEQGTMEIHMVILRDGHVESVEIISGSGSRWIDMAGESVFRYAHLRPFPLSTPEPRADVYATLQYILVRR